MSEETKDIEETKVAEEKKMETEQTILSPAFYDLVTF